MPDIKPIVTKLTNTTANQNPNVRLYTNNGSQDDSVRDNKYQLKMDDTYYRSNNNDQKYTILDAGGTEEVYITADVIEESVTKKMAEDGTTIFEFDVRASDGENVRHGVLQTNTKLERFYELDPKTGDYKEIKAGVFGNCNPSEVNELLKTD